MMLVGVKSKLKQAIVTTRIMKEEKFVIGETKVEFQIEAR